MPESANAPTAPDRPEDAEVVFVLDYDREVIYLTREGRLRPGRAPGAVKRG